MVLVIPVGYVVRVLVLIIYGFIRVKVVGIGKTIKNFKDADHPDLLKLPFPDQTYSILQHWFSKESGSTTGETSERNLINYISHQHVLSLKSHMKLTQITFFHDVRGEPCVAEGSRYYGEHVQLDKHPMKLTYGPVENHKSEYICEVCEEELNPNIWFYHCHVCAYSLHTRCAPLIVNFEAAIPSYRSLYEYLNIKFWGLVISKVTSTLDHLL
ncbi:zinc finger, PHD-type containing protein [Tanacetum coccineum]